jgi:hypothetical protein
VIGTLGAEQDIPLPYRGQDPPQLPAPAVLAALPTEEARAFALKRCMTRSSSSSTPVPHASLGLPAYVQFTSPIRRYSDVIAHFQVKAWLRGADLPFSSRDITSMMASVSEYGRDLNRCAAGWLGWLAAAVQRPAALLLAAMWPLWGQAPGGGWLCHSLTHCQWFPVTPQWCMLALL